MSTIESSLASNLGHDLTSIFGQVYRANGWNPMSVWDGYSVAAVAAGIGAPPGYSAAPGQTNVVQTTDGTILTWITPGTHLMRYRYANSKTQYVSNPSPLVSFNATGSASGTGSIYSFSGLTKSTDPKVDRCVIEMTDAGGATFFKATTLANSAWHSVALQTKDNVLRAAPLFWKEYGHDVPPYFNLIEQFRGRLWGMGQVVYSIGQAQIAGATVAVSGNGTTWTSAAKGRLLYLSGGTRTFIESVLSTTELKLESAHASASLRTYAITSEVPDVLRFSQVLYPEAWPAENAMRVLDGKPEKAKALKGFRQDLVVFGERNMERLVYGENPFRDGALEPVQGERGAASRRVVQDVGGSLYALDYKGLHRYAGGTPDHMSEAIDPLFDPGDNRYGYVDFNYRSTFHSVHYPHRHQILWFVVMNGDPDDGTAYIKPHHAICLDYLNGTLGLLKFDVGIVASTAAPGEDGQAQTLLADEYGRLWIYGLGTTDGVSPSSARSFLCDSATAASNIVASSSVLYVAYDGLKGAMAYWVEGNETQRIISNSVMGLLLSVGFSTAPSAGHTVTLGRIPFKWKSKAFTFQSPSFRRFDGRYLHLYYEPQTSGEIRVRFYLDRSSTAYDDYSEDYSSGGVSVDADNNYFTVDLTTASGYAKIPLPSDASMTLEFEVEIVDSATSFEMTSYEIDAYGEEEDLGE